MNLPIDFEALRIQQEFYQIEEGARVDALRREREAERAACAELVRAGGCICGLVKHGDLVDGVVRRHCSACPQALAAAIETRR